MLAMTQHSREEIKKALQAKKYKVLTFTHVSLPILPPDVAFPDLRVCPPTDTPPPRPTTKVDTSTGVLSDAKMIGEVVREVSPETLVVLDGVCSVASEEIR